MADFVIPSARAVLLCRHVADAEKGNVHAGWMFDAIRPTEYPHTQDIICALVHLSDGFGDVPVSVKILQLVDEGDDNDPQLIQATHPVLVHFPDRLSIQRVVLRLTAVVFPEPGLYLIETHCGDECVGDTTLRLQPVLKEQD